MTHHTEAERAEFEAFASDNGKFPKAIERDAKGNYLLMHTAIGWMWWQAARRAPAVPVPHDVVRDACARMCDARAESLQAGNMFTAANEAFKCAMAIRTHPAYQHHLRAAMLAAAPQPPVPQVTPEMIEAAEEAYMPFGDMGLAIQCALSAAPQPPEVVCSVSNGETEEEPRAFETHVAAPVPQARKPLTDEECDRLISALCPDFTDERFPTDRPVMRQLARDAIAHSIGAAHGQ